MIISHFLTQLCSNDFVLGVSGDSIWNSCLGTTALAVSTNIPEEVSAWILMSHHLHSVTSVCVHVCWCMCVYVHCQVKLYSQVFVSETDLLIWCVCVFTCLHVCVCMCVVYVLLCGSLWLALFVIIVTGVFCL